MVTSLQTTDKFLLEHPYAQTQLYPTQLYTEGLGFLSILGALMKIPAAASVAKELAKMGLKRLLELTPWLIAYQFDGWGYSIGSGEGIDTTKIGIQDPSTFVPGETPTDFPLINHGGIESFNGYNTVAVTIFIGMCLYYVRQGKYMRALICIIAIIPGLDSTLQMQLFGAAGTALLLTTAVSKIAQIDFNNEANKAIYIKIIVKLKKQLIKVINGTSIISQPLKEKLLKALKFILAKPVQDSKAQQTQQPQQPQNVIQFPKQQ